MGLANRACASNLAMVWQCDWAQQARVLSRISSQCNLKDKDRRALGRWGGPNSGLLPNTPVPFS